MKFRCLLFLAAFLVMNLQMFAAPFTFNTLLSGANENPSNSSTATGSAHVIMDIVAHTLNVDVTFAGLSSPATAAHIHCCTAPPLNIGVATTLIGFPAATSGTYVHTFDTTLTSSFSGSFIALHGGTAGGAEAALFAGLLDGQAYLNIHDVEFPGGQIRGFLTAAVPEPSTMVLLASGLAGIALFRRRLANQQS